MDTTSIQVVFAWFSLAIAKTMTIAMTGDSSVVAIIFVHRLSGRHYHVPQILVYLHMDIYPHGHSHYVYFNSRLVYLNVSFPLALSQGVDYARRS